MISYLLYKVTKTPNGTSVTKVGDVIEATKCSGNFSWHQDIRATEIGLLYFKVRGENKNEDG